MDKPGSRWVTLGRISGVFGVRGWMKVFSDTAPAANILSFRTWYLDIEGQRKAFEIEEGRPHGKGIIVKLKGCDDRDRAAAFIGSRISVPRETLPAVGDEEFYWTDLEGLSVRNLQGVDLGKLDLVLLERESLFGTGSNDVMVVLGDRQRLIPFTTDAVTSVDLETGLITVDWDPDF